MICRFWQEELRGIPSSLLRLGCGDLTSKEALALALVISSENSCQQRRFSYFYGPVTIELPWAFHSFMPPAMLVTLV